MFNIYRQNKIQVVVQNEKILMIAFASKSVAKWVQPLVVGICSVTISLKVNLIISFKIYRFFDLTVIFIKAF